MEFGLTNLKLAASAAQQVKSAQPPEHIAGKPSTTSIAEGAVFIPKPHKRVSFETTTGNPTSNLPGNNQNSAPNSTDSFKMGMGSNVEMKIHLDPSKDFSVIAPQEEGRQVNHPQTHFTQQYDSYGRPIIGFSREPYDFAATKYISRTSQIKFYMNMAETSGSAKPELGTGPAVPGAGGSDMGGKPELQAGFGGATAPAPGEPQVQTLGDTPQQSDAGAGAQSAPTLIDIMREEYKSKFPLGADKLPDGNLANDSTGQTGHGAPQDPAAQGMVGAANIMKSFEEKAVSAEELQKEMSMGDKALEPIEKPHPDQASQPMQNGAPAGQASQAQPERQIQAKFTPASDATAKASELNIKV